MNIEELPINDNFTQCVRGMKLLSEKYYMFRKNQMKRCNHLFVLTKKGYYIGSDHSSDYIYQPNEIECVHCGITNKFIHLEEMIIEFNRKAIAYSKTIETEMFLEIFGNNNIESIKTLDKNTFTLISNEELNTYHPRLLYTLALQINELAEQDELFEIMKRLHELESSQEKLRLTTVEQTSDLLKRYEEKYKVFVKKNGK